MVVRSSKDSGEEYLSEMEGQLPYEIRVVLDQVGLQASKGRLSTFNIRWNGHFLTFAIWAEAGNKTSRPL